MQRYQLTALRPIEFSATFPGSDTPQIVALEPGECRAGIRTVHRVVEVHGPRRLEIVPHPGEIGAVVTLEDLAKLERLPQ